MPSKEMNYPKMTKELQEQVTALETGKDLKKTDESIRVSAMLPPSVHLCAIGVLRDGGLLKLAVPYRRTDSRRLVS